MKNKIHLIKEEIFGVIVVFFALFMIYASMEVSRAANTANSELYQNIVTGSLDIAAQNSNISFNNTNAGTAANSLMNFNNVKVTDYRGTGAGWAATTGSIENFVDSTDTNVQITLNSSLKWSPGDITNLNGSTITGVTAGTDGVYLNTTRNLMTATASNGLGAYQIDNTLLNFEVEAADPSGNYAATMTLTVA
ncbi:MAG: hypothetical protein PHI73_03910 [Patescibacteria group bacterium]|nr:hypothetical protein [Patescibacteria group bacterium]